MTTVTKLFFFAPLLFTVLLLSSCKGPEGPAGRDGTTGAQGPKGDPGTPGTANVIYSEWKSVTTNMWTRTTSSGVTRYRHDITAAPLDQTVLDRGMVLVYVKLSQDENQVRSLPYFVTSNLTQLRLEFSLLEKIVRLWSVDISEGQTPPEGQYRYIIVPGGQAGRLGGRAISYQEAAELFNLPD